MMYMHALQSKSKYSSSLSANKSEKIMQTFLSVKNIKILVQYNKPLVAGALHGRGTIYSDTDQINFEISKSNHCAYSM